MVEKMIFKNVSADQLECLIRFVDSPKNIVTVLFENSQPGALRIVEIVKIKMGKAALPMPEGSDVTIRIVDEYTKPDGEKVLVSRKCMFGIYKCLGLDYD